jgi:hypothetical protein
MTAVIRRDSVEGTMGMKTLVSTILLALAATSAAIASPTSPTVASPVAISTCRFDVFTADGFYGELSLSRERTLWVTFKNTGDVTLTAITFDAVKDGEHLVVVDKGRFSRGASITHQLIGYSTDLGGGLEHTSPGGSDSCKVTAAR